jgi:hypothetical protein
MPGKPQQKGYHMNEIAARNSKIIEKLQQLTNSPNSLIPTLNAQMAECEQYLRNIAIQKSRDYKAAI